jgi:hypothetical protein
LNKQTYKQLFLKYLCRYRASRSGSKYRRLWRL